MAKKGSFVFWVIIIIVLVIFAGTLSAWLIVTGGKLLQRGEETVEQIGIRARILPTAQYNVTFLGASKGILDIRILDTRGTRNTNDDIYLTSIPITGYKVFDNNVQTAVFDVEAFPVAFMAAVVDPQSQKFAEAFDELAAIRLADANIALIPVNDVPAKAEFASSGNLSKPSAAGGASYWGGLAVAAEGIPTVPARREIGPNFNAVILVSEGRCTLDCNNQDLISTALNMSRDTRFYMLRSSCTNLDATSKTTLESLTSSRTVTSRCYTSADELFSDLIEEASTITVRYEPKFEAARAGAERPHEIRVEVTHRIGPFGEQAVFGGKATTPEEIAPIY